MPRLACAVEQQQANRSSQEQRGQQQPRHAARGRARFFFRRALHGIFAGHRLYGPACLGRSTAIGCLEHEALRVEHHLVARPQQRAADRPTVHHTALVRAEVAQHHAFRMRFEAGVAIGERGIVDADLALGQASDLTRLVEGDAAAVMRATEAAQHHPRIGALLARHGPRITRPGFDWRRRRRLAEQQPFIAIDEDRIARAKHGHASHRTTIYMQPARTFAHLQPDTSAIDAELRDGLPGIVDDDRTIDQIAADGMHAWTEDKVRLLAIGKPQSQGSHVAVNMARPQSSMVRAICRRIHVPSDTGLDGRAAARTMRRTGGTTMPNIDIRHVHSLSHAKARKAVQEVAEKLAERFGVDYDWDGDTLNFARSGVDGKIDLAPKSLRVTANLGFLMSAFKGPIESEIKRVLDERFS